MLLKDEMGLMMKNFNIFGVHWKIWFLGGRVSRKTNIEGGGLPKKSGLGQFADLRGGLARKRGSGVSKAHDVSTSDHKNMLRYLIESCVLLEYLVIWLFQGY